MSRFPSDITDTVAALAKHAPGNLQAWMARHEARVRTVVGLAARKARPQTAPSGKPVDLSVFNRWYPYHRDLEAIDAVGSTRRALAGDIVPWPRARTMARTGLINILDSPFGHEMTLTDWGYESLKQSREAFLDL